MTDFRGADAEGEGAERAMGGRVAVATDNGLTRLGDAELGANDVDDAAPLVLQAEQFDARKASPEQLKARLAQLGIQYSRG